MNFTASSLALVCAVAFSGAALAESITTSASSAGSSASSAGSASVRGSSNSLTSSSGEEKKQAEVKDGDYRVAAVETVAERPGLLRLTLEAQGAAPSDAMRLDVPVRAFGEQPPVAGEVIQASHRPYGLQFARGADRQAFFLVLADNWNRELDARPLVR